MILLQNGRDHCEKKKRVIPSQVRCRRCDRRFGWRRCRHCRRRRRRRRSCSSFTFGQKEIESRFGSGGRTTTSDGRREDGRTDADGLPTKRKGTVHTELSITGRRHRFMQIEAKSKYLPRTEQGKTTGQILPSIHNGARHDQVSEVARIPRHGNSFPYDTLVP